MSNDLRVSTDGLIMVWVEIRLSLHEFRLEIGLLISLRIIMQVSSWGLTTFISKIHYHKQGEILNNFGQDLIKSTPRILMLFNSIYIMTGLHGHLGQAPHTLHCNAIKIRWVSMFPSSCNKRHEKYNPWWQQAIKLTASFESHP